MLGDELQREVDRTLVKHGGLSSLQHSALQREILCNQLRLARITVRKSGIVRPSSSPVRGILTEQIHHELLPPTFGGLVGLDILPGLVADTKCSVIVDVALWAPRWQPPAYDLAHQNFAGYRVDFQKIGRCWLAAGPDRPRLDSHATERPR